MEQSKSLPIDITLPKGKPPVLRSSCNACAEAKVGCTKEKPACARCSRRDEPCVYAITRRAGRRPRNKQPPAEDAPPLVSEPSSAHETPRSASISHQQDNDSLPNLTFLTSPELTSASLDGYPSSDDFSSGYGDFFAHMPPVDMTSQHTMLPEFRPHYDNFLAANTHFQPLDPSSQARFQPRLVDGDTGMTFDTNGFANAGMFQIEDGVSSELYPVDSNGMNDFKFTNSVHGGFSHMTASPPTSSAWSSASTAPLTSSSTSVSTPPSDAPSSRTGSDVNLFGSRSGVCECLTNGLSLLNSLSPPNLEAISSSKHNAHSMDGAPSFEAVMAQNETAINTVGEILRCPCPHDDSLLFILSLVAFKILGWYAAAASTVHRSEHSMDVDAHSEQGRNMMRSSPGSMSANDFHGERPDRIICQLVLSKTCSVQRIVNSLSQRLLAAEQHRGQQPGSPGHMSRRSSAANDLLFDGVLLHSNASHGMASGLETHLRSRLRELSQALIEKLSER